MINLDDLTTVFRLSNEYQGQTLTEDEQRVVRDSVHAYYQVLAIKAWCYLLDIPSALEVPGLDTVDFDKLGLLYQKVTGHECL